MPLTHCYVNYTTKVSTKHCLGVQLLSIRKIALNWHLNFDEEYQVSFWDNYKYFIVM